MANVEAVIFDCDGVVVDSQNLQTQAEQRTAQSFSEMHGLPYDPNSIDWASMEGWGRTKIAAKIFGIEADSEVAEEFREAVVDTTVEIACNENLRLVDGVDSFMDFMRLKGVTLGLATSSNRRIYQQYCVVSRIDYFRPEFVVAHREAVDSKPKPGPYLEVMKRMDVDPRRTLVIEDSSSGIAAGRYAGAIVLGLATSKSEDYLMETDAHIVAGDFEEAARLLQPLLP